MTIPTQIQTKSRSLTIDALRGFALFGIFLTHMITWFVGGPLPESYYMAYQEVPGSIGFAFYLLFVNSKFFAIFAFLFGLSFTIQMQSMQLKYVNSTLRFAWRLCILGLIAVLHHCFWRADILTIYVPLGFVLLCCRNLPDKSLLILGLIFVFNLPSKIVEVVGILGFNYYPLMDPMTELDSQAVLKAVTQANLPELIQHNIHAAYAKLAYQINSGRLWITFGFFLLGMLVGRLGWYAKIEQYKNRIKEICKKTAWAFLLLIICGTILVTIFLANGMDLLKNDDLFSWLTGFWFNSISACLIFIYICGFSLLMQKTRFFRVLSKFAYAGKMALTTYLLQSVFGVLIFFNVGLGLFNMTSPLLNACIAISVFGLQIYICRLWLRRFNYGPIEWLWRSGTMFKWQKMRKQNI